MQILNPKSKILYQENGFIFLEILIGIALIGIVFTTLLGMGFLSLNISTTIKKTTQADALIREEMEGVRAFRDATTWASDGLGVTQKGSANPYYVNLDTSVNPPKWILQAGTQSTGIFTRQIVFDNVYRDASGNIASSGTLDANTVKATVTVSWEGKTAQVVTYFTNWK